MTPAGPPRAYARLALAIGAAAIGFAVMLGRLSGGGDFFSSYPFITDDGFDWLFEGHGLRQWLSGSTPPVFPILRAPGFVCVTALDAFAGAEGTVIIFVFASCYAIGGLLLIATARLYQASTAATMAAVVVYLLSPVNFFRLFILADAIALTWMLASTYFLLRYLRSGSGKSLLLSAVMAFIGAMTQTYAAIPLLVGLPLIGIRRRQRRETMRIAAAVVAVATLFLILKTLWTKSIPHSGEPSQFSLLRISTDMAGFYGNVWTYFLLPIVPALLAAGYRWLRLGRPFAPECGILGAAIAVFLALTFFYQWPEARFTFVYFPLPLLLYLALSAEGPNETRGRWVGTTGAGVSVLLVALQLCITPEEYWGPTLRSLAWEPSRSWVGKALTAKTEDRFGLGTGAPTLPNPAARVPPGLGPYKDATFSTYLTIRNPVARRLPPPAATLQLSWKDHHWAADDADAAGFVESFIVRQDNLEITGWAADRHLGRAVGIFVYAGETLVTSTPCNVVRADVSRALGLPAEPAVGFALEFPLNVPPDDIVVVALLPNGRSHRLKSIGDRRVN